MFAVGLKAKPGRSCGGTTEAYLRSLAALSAILRRLFMWNNFRYKTRQYGNKDTVTRHGQQLFIYFYHGSVTAQILSLVTVLGQELLMLNCSIGGGGFGCGSGRNPSLMYIFIYICIHVYICIYIYFVDIKVLLN